MLRVIYGKSHSGKTEKIINEISGFVNYSQSRNTVDRIVMIVPEQYCHEAERELSAKCGPTLSRFAEVMSFSAYARKVFSQTGGIAKEYLDNGGRLLCMTLALRELRDLKVFKDAATRPDLQKALLGAVTELKRSSINPEELAQLADEAGDGLSEKVQELALIAEAYNAIVSRGNADPEDRLSTLAKKLAGMDGSGKKIYIDGFVDFTQTENEVVFALLKSGADVTVCLTADGVEDGSEIFTPSRAAAQKLLRFAKENGIRTEIEAATQNGRMNSAGMLAEHLFSYFSEALEDDGSVEILSADTPDAECEAAAAKIVELLRDKGCRMRDIAIAVRGYDDYRLALESALEFYGIPYYTTKKTPIGSSPIAEFIRCAYAVTLGQWNPDDIISYIETGLTGLSPEEADILTDYIFKWEPAASSWRGRREWRQNPDGYSSLGKPDEHAQERLKEINSLRSRLAEPLLTFEAANRNARTAAEYAQALAELFEETEITKILDARAQMHRTAGRQQRADELEQLWETVIAALEQISAVMGTNETEAEEFEKLFLMMLGQYEIGTIPSSLDMVSAGDFDRMRRRNIKYLIVLGADDSRIPYTQGGSGLFSDDERRALKALGTVIGADPDVDVWREFSLIYNVIALPSDGLIMIRSKTDRDGNQLAPALPVGTARKLFNMAEKDININQCRLNAFAPALMLAAGGEGPEADAARKYFEEHNPELLERAQAAAQMKRGRLSAGGVNNLYGDKIFISASRADTFYSCKYMYFCNYGMNAQPYKKAKFDASETGTFMHYVLENVAGEVKAAGGFKAVEPEFITACTEKYIKQFEENELNSFEEKTTRFKYLFKRAESDVHRVVEDMAEELRNSEFEPAAFELNFRENRRFRPVVLKNGETLNLSGIADRVDVWRNGGKAYMRVVDYKTGTKEFKLREVANGRELQMLQYLLCLSENPDAARETLGVREDMELVPAGIMYVPARSKYVSVNAPDEDAINKEKREHLKRSGLVLTEDGVPEAWEKPETINISPLTHKDSGVTGEEIDTLFGHVEKKLSEMAKSIKNGEIEANPFKDGENTPCTYCSFGGMCAFADGENGERYNDYFKGKNDEIWAQIRGEAESNE